MFWDWASGFCAIVKRDFIHRGKRFGLLGGRAHRSARRAMSRRVIFTADDFGLDEAVNEAVERAHRDGVLTSASLMVTGAAAEDAMARAKRLPGLAVGLHLVLVQGKPALSREDAAPLSGAAGAFLDSPARAGLHYFFSRPRGGLSRKKSARSSKRSAVPVCRSIMSTVTPICTFTRRSSRCCWRSDRDTA